MSLLGNWWMWCRLRGWFKAFPLTYYTADLMKPPEGGFFLPVQNDLLNCYGVTYFTHTLNYRQSRRNNMHLQRHKRGDGAAYLQRQLHFISQENLKGHLKALNITNIHRSPIASSRPWLAIETAARRAD
ncbi:hypothetical protein [Azohydromonas aeria]|uniref:hypothetical protein n=1 Tax=Azohydromonas aeria TaxID=2590212 RepID=UPI0012F7187A|nr:hypothetical protein [Azohydromonas aeria]